MQEIYILALKNPEKLNDHTLFVAWLNRISFNVCYDISAKSKGTTSPATDPEVLDSLPFQEKQVITMRFYNDMKLVEIADACGISRSSVKRYLASGQATLQKKNERIGCRPCGFAIAKKMN